MGKQSRLQEFSCLPQLVQRAALKQRPTQVPVRIKPKCPIHQAPTPLKRLTAARRLTLHVSSLSAGQASPGITFQSPPQSTPVFMANVAQLEERLRVGLTLPVRASVLNTTPVRNLENVRNPLQSRSLWALTRLCSTARQTQKSDVASSVILYKHGQTF